MSGRFRQKNKKTPKFNEEQIERKGGGVDSVKKRQRKDKDMTSHVD